MRLPFRHSGNFKQECIPTASEWVVAQYYPHYPRHKLLTELFGPNLVGVLFFELQPCLIKSRRWLPVQRSPLCILVSFNRGGPIPYGNDSDEHSVFCRLFARGA